MKRMSNAKIWLPAAGLVLLGVLIFAFGLLDTQRTFADVAYGPLSFTHDRRSLSLEEGDSYGLMDIQGTDFDLPAGDYRMKWEMDGDGERVLHFGSTNGAVISPDTFSLPVGETSGFCEFTIKEACEAFQIDIEFVSGTYITVENLRMYSPMYKDNAVTLLLLLTLAAILYVCYGYGWLHREQAGMLVLVALAVLIASTVSLKQTLNIAHDTGFHMARLENLASGLRAGQFPVRMGGYSYNGFGAITSVFYPDFFLYPFAVLRILGASPTYVMNLYMVMMNVFSALTMYCCAKRLFGEQWIAVCASILYVLAIYRVSNAYTRCAVGEITAMMMIPIFLLGLWEVVYGDKKRYATLVWGASGVFLSHMLSTAICGATAVVFCLLHIVRIVREKRLLSIVKAAVLTVLLCAFQLVPLLTYSMNGIGAEGLANDVSATAFEPAQLFLLGTGSTLLPRDVRLASFSLEIGFALVLCAALALYALVMRREWGLQERTVRTALIGGLLFALGCTMLFPWKQLSLLTGGLSDYLQFSWRLLMMVTPLLALAGGYGAVRFAGGKPEAMAAFVLALSAFCVLPTINRETRYDEYLDFGEGGNPDLQYIEYTLPDTQPYWTTDHALYIDGQAEVTQYEKQGTNITAQVRAENYAQVSLPIFDYPGLVAAVDGQRMETWRGEYNRLVVNLPAGTQGSLRVWFEGKGYWRAADAVSLLTLIFLCVCAVRSRKRAQGKA